MLIEPGSDWCHGRMPQADVQHLAGARQETQVAGLAIAFGEPCKDAKYLGGALGTKNGIGLPECLFVKAVITMARKAQ
jgi:hypothetical protein